MINSKRGRICLKFLAAAALIIALAYSAFVLAANPSAVPRIVTDKNASTHYVTIASAGEQLFAETAKARFRSLLLADRAVQGVVA